MKTEESNKQLMDEMRALKSLIYSRQNSVHSRPALDVKAANDDHHVKAMNSYIRYGDESLIREIEVEGKGLQAAVSSEGGVLLASQTAERIETVLKDGASLRALANVVNVEASSYEVLVDQGDFVSGWVAESDARDETDTSKFVRVSIALHELSAMPKSSQRLLDDAAFDVEAWLAERIAESFVKSEARAFIHGDGVNKPKGILAHPLVEQANWGWGKLGFVKTGVAGDFDGNAPADALIDLIYALPAFYRQNANFVMNSKTAGAVRKMKDADGRFLWADGVQAEQSARFFGYPVFVCEDMPDVGADEVAIAFGDFQAAYTIAERPDLRILRDPFSAKPHVLFYATKRVGGDVTNFDAVKLLQFSA